MHDTQLNLCPRKDTLDGFGKPLSAVDRRDQDILDAAILQLGEDTETESSSTLSFNKLWLTEAHLRSATLEAGLDASPRILTDD